MSSDAIVDQTDRATILKMLSESSAAFEDAVAGVSKDDAAHKPADGGWSITEIAEHVSVAEEGMFFMLTERFRPIPEAAPDQQKETRLVNITLNRNQKMESPEVSKPSGKFASLSEALAHFRACRARTIHYVEQSKDDQRKRSVKHPLAGVVTGYEYMLILANHPTRHAAQVREVRSNLGF
ncbi:MAG: DinB family protein [Deltaproteobacteria bacterium]